ncbi:MAG: T9SS type A sorting domain-containing protein [Fluviicola sp.]|nr:T9SS type A sorting domain-containing protein [Fluviicola sp.]
MNIKSLGSIALFIGISHLSISQFIVKPTFFETNDVSNQGLVVGYGEWGGPYSIWTPETGVIDTIGGIAPGNGVGGRAMFSADGTFLSGTNNGSQGPEPARYNRTNDTWTALGNLGFSLDATAGAGYAISGDGNTVVGNAWADTTGGYAYTDAIAWNQTEGIMDLGTLFLGRSTRANAVSSDGSVVVGWQDFNGPWKSAVWRKNPQGGYYPNEYILLDPQGNPSDEFNQMGECSAISANGVWVGGEGDFANNGNPWIWSEATGVIDLGTLSAGGNGYVAAINENGTVAVGRIQVGPWDPELPFIWTTSGGMQNLNDYVQNTLGLSMGTNVIYSANCMSPSGQYIAGYGVNTATFEYFAYRVSLSPLGVDENTQAEISAYPNPATDQLTIENTGNATMVVTNPEGKTIAKTTIIGNSTLDVSAYAPGVYFLSVEAQDTKTVKTIRFVKK